MKSSVLKNDRRKHIRACHERDYCVILGKNETITCDLKNISATGACVIPNALLRQGERVELHICRNVDLAMNAEVVWVREDECGLSFILDTSESFQTISFIMNNISQL